MGPTGRAAAYSELVAGLLDVRDDSPTRRFDEALRRAVAEGHLDEPRAATLRWLQRLSVDAVVEHARSALPAALLGLDEARETVANLQSSAQQSSSVTAATKDSHVPRDVARGEGATSGDVASPEMHEAPARRLLVAGLTMLSVPRPEPQS